MTQPEFGAVRWSENPREYKRIYNREHRRGLRRTNGKRSVLLRMLDKINRDPGEPLIENAELLERLGFCWPWYGALNTDGYGVIRGDEGALVLVHRVALTAALGRPLGEGMESCHRCNVRHCTRPRHLYEGTRRDNEDDKRGLGWALKPPKPLAVP